MCARALDTSLAQPGGDACHDCIHAACELRRGALCNEDLVLLVRVEALVVRLVLAVKFVGPEHAAQFRFGVVVPPEYVFVHALEAQMVDRCELDPGRV